MSRSRMDVILKIVYGYCCYSTSLKEETKLVAIHVNTDAYPQSLESLALDASQDAVVIEGVSKIFKKSRPLLRWRKKEGQARGTCRR